jgi:Ulp1 family protease
VEDLVVNTKADVEALEGAPIQVDGNSCGVFMLAFASLLAKGHSPPFKFSQEDIMAMRIRMTHDILMLVSE